MFKYETNDIFYNSNNACKKHRMRKQDTFFKNITLQLKGL